jgi:uncharacterized protein YggE
VEVRGAPADLQKYLQPARRTVTLTGHAKQTVDEAIRAEKFSSSPQFGWFDRSPSSYEVINRLIVDVTDDAQLIRVSEIAAQSADTSIGTIAFEYTQRAALQETVRHLAFDDAIARKAF